MKRKRICYLFITIIIAAGFIYLQNRESEVLYSNKLAYSPSPVDNPLIGFVSWEDSITDFPHSLEYYSFPLSDVQKEYDSFNWDVLENALNSARSRGNQAIIRFYLDFPGRQSGIPQFLFNDGLEVFEYSIGGDSGICPDYSDKNLQKALVNFIEAFGSKYDGDPRIGFIQCGLLGFWGEWHTYPYSEWYPEKETYIRIADAYEKNFVITKVMAGEVEESIADNNIGYHDDMFPVDSQYIYQSMIENKVNNKWMSCAIGGELAPAEQEEYFNEVNPQWEEYASLMHPSWCLNSKITEYAGIKKENAILAASNLGYSFTIKECKVKIQSNKLDISLIAENIGNAPFYYDWDIKLRISDEEGTIIKEESTGWSLKDITELNKDYSFDYILNEINLSRDSRYTISVKVINPMENGKTLRFANKEQNDDGWLELIEIKNNND